MTFPPTLTEIIAAIKARDAASGPKNIQRWDTALAARVEALQGAIDKAMGDLEWGDVQAATRRLRGVGAMP